jgi:hypothetical protein
MGHNKTHVSSLVPATCPDAETNGSDTSDPTDGNGLVRSANRPYRIDANAGKSSECGLHEMAQPHRWRKAQVPLQRMGNSPSAGLEFMSLIRVYNAHRSVGLV